MNVRTLGVAVVATATMAATPAVSSAVTTSTSKPSIDILGGASFKANRYIRDEMRFSKDVYRLKSGTTIQIRSKTPDEPHTVSVVRRADFPKTVKGFETCFTEGACGKLGQAHGFPEGDGPPTTPLVNAGKTGFDQRSDSIVIGPGDKGSVKLTATKGKTLHLLCIIHPWMQARIVVR